MSLETDTTTNVKQEESDVCVEVEEIARAELGAAAVVAALENEDDNEGESDQEQPAASVDDDNTKDDINLEECQQNYGKRSLSNVGMPQQDLWESRYQFLKKFKLKYDHVNVTIRTKGYEKLGKWLDVQRTFLPKDSYLSGYPSMKSERIRKLEELGVKLYVSNDKTWKKNYRDLVQYMTKYNGKLPKKNESKLGRWLCNQKKRMSTKQFAKSPHVREERLRLFKEIGIDIASCSSNSSTATGIVSSVTNNTAAGNRNESSSTATPKLSIGEGSNKEERNIFHANYQNNKRKRIEVDTSSILFVEDGSSVTAGISAATTGELAVYCHKGDQSLSLNADSCGSGKMTETRPSSIIDEETASTITGVTEKVVVSQQASV